MEEKSQLSLYLYDISEGKLFQGTVDSISSYNNLGYFDILLNAGHFISLIYKQLIYIKDGKKKTFNIHNGVIRCLDNKVEAYIELETTDNLKQESK